MQTNKEILDSFLIKLTLLHEDDDLLDNIPLPHTFLNQIHAMFHRDWRDYCDHDECVQHSFYVNASTINPLLMPGMYKLHAVVHDLMLSSLSEMAGKNAGNEAEEFLRNL